MKKIYIASPFFNEEQLERVMFIEDILKEHDFEYFSPRLDTYVKPNSNNNERNNAFYANLNAIDDAQLIVVITDGKDVGTIFEAGYAYAKGIRIIYFAETLGDKPFNLMLAISGSKICKSRKEFENEIKNNFSNSETFEGEIE
jgi:nucleoside 2-deoxyribosyltransferase